MHSVRVPVGEWRPFIRVHRRDKPAEGYYPHCCIDNRAANESPWKRDPAVSMTSIVMYITLSCNHERKVIRLR